MAAQREHEILSGEPKNRRSHEHTWHDAINRFIKEEVPRRKGGRSDKIRLLRLMRDFEDKRLDKLTKDDFTDWRNRRLDSVQSSSARREMGTMQAVLRCAVSDWGWLDENPLAGIKKPANNPHRTRIVSDDEIREMCASLRYKEGAPIILQKQKVAIAMLISLETGMRAGEVLRCVVRGKVGHLAATKNGDTREVPLSSRARELFEIVEGRLDLKSGTLDTQFREARKAAGLSGFTFHDLRATACTRMARRGIDVLTLAKIIGHRDIKSLQIYYRESAEDIADRL